MGKVCTICLIFLMYPVAWRQQQLVLIAHCVGLHYYAQVSHLLTDVQASACYLPNAVILPLVLYGCETWSLTLSKQRRLRVLENRALRRIFGPKRDEVTGEWRKLYNREFHDLYSSPNIDRVIKLRRMRWVGHVAHMGERCMQGFGGETWGKKATWKTQA